MKRPINWRHPQAGDRRTLLKFAWLPVQIDADTEIWLESYEEYQVYEMDPDLSGRWVKVSRAICKDWI